MVMGEKLPPDHKCVKNAIYNDWNGKLFYLIKKSEVYGTHSLQHLPMCMNKVTNQYLLRKLSKYRYWSEYCCYCLGNVLGFNLTYRDHTANREHPATCLRWDRKKVLIKRVHTKATSFMTHAVLKHKNHKHMYDNFFGPFEWYTFHKKIMHYDKVELRENFKESRKKIYIFLMVFGTSFLFLFLILK